jgi:uncharacterized membrane protein
LLGAAIVGLVASILFVWLVLKLSGLNKKEKKLKLLIYFSVISVAQYILLSFVDRTGGGADSSTGNFLILGISLPLAIIFLIICLVKGSRQTSSTKQKI